MGNLKINWDAWGIGTSLACAIHCAVLPLLASSLPLFGINIIHNTWFEWFMILLATGIGIYSLYHGFKKHHRQYFPILLFSTGIIFLILKQILVAHEVWLLIPAVMCIVVAHFLNYRLCRKMMHAANCTHHQH